MAVYLTRYCLRCCRRGIKKDPSGVGPSHFSSRYGGDARGQSGAPLNAPAGVPKALKHREGGTFPVHSCQRHCAERRWRLYVLRNLLVAAQGTSNLRRCKNGWLALPPELPPDGAGLAQTNWDQGASAFAVMSIRSILVGSQGTGKIEIN